MSTPSLKARQLYNQIREDLKTLHYRLKLFYQIYDTQETLDMLHRWGEVLFFRVLYYDMVDALAIGIARFFDRASSPHGARASLYMFASLVAQLDPALGKELRTDIKENERKSKRIIDWRNKWVGHRDYKVVLAVQASLLGKGNSPIGFDLTEASAALDGIEGILNKFAASYSDEGRIIIATRKEARNVLYWIEKPMNYADRTATDQGKKLIDLIKSTST